MSGLSKYLDKNKREQRRHNHIAKDLRSNKYKHHIIDRKRTEDELERRFRRYGDIDLDEV